MLCMSGCRSAVVIAAMALAAGEAWADPPLRLASDDWCPFVCANDGKLGGGYLVELVAQAMATQGYRIEAVLMPLNRAIAETVSGGVEGVYAPPIDARLRLSAPIAHSRACFYTRREQSWRYQGMSSLQQRTLGIIDDYGYDDAAMDAYIGRLRADRKSHKRIDISYGEHAGRINLQKLLGGRFEVLLEHELVMQHLLRKLDAGERVRSAGCLEHALPLVLGFAFADRRAGQWIKALGDGLHHLESTGALKALQQRYELPAMPGAALR